MIPNNKQASIFMADMQNDIRINLVDNPSIKGREDHYMIVSVNLDKVLESWKISLFSFEWLTAEGNIRKPDHLPEQEREKYKTVCDALSSGDKLPRPILGIGVMDNVEIGSRRDVLLTLITKNIKTLDVHIPKSLEEDFTPYL